VVSWVRSGMRGSLPELRRKQGNRRAEHERSLAVRRRGDARKTTRALDRGALPGRVRGAPRSRGALLPRRAAGHTLQRRRSSTRPTSGSPRTAPGRGGAGTSSSRSRRRRCGGSSSTTRASAGRSSAGGAHGPSRSTCTPPAATLFATRATDVDFATLDDALRRLNELEPRQASSSSSASSRPEPPTHAAALIGSLQQPPYKDWEMAKAWLWRVGG
jgi:hypothetical protein